MFDIPHCEHTRHYFASSHRKGPVNGIGGSAKRFVWNMVCFGKAQVIDSSSFSNAAIGMKNVNVEDASAQELKSRASKLKQDDVFKAAPVVGGADLSKDLDVTPVRGMSPTQPLQQPMQ